MGLLDRFRKQPAPPIRPRGGSGRAHTSGFLELEELNTDLQHPQSARIFDEMYRTDPDCFRSLRMVVNPLVAGTWTLNPYGGKEADAKALKHVEFCQWALFDCMRPTLPRHLQSAIPLFTRQGFGPYEQVWWDQQWEGKTVLTLRTLGVRLPRTVQEWHQDEFGDLQKIVQFLAALEAGGLKGGLKEIPARDLVYYRVGEEGDNWEGVSLLRPAYKPWYLKDRIERLDAIAHEREATGLPVVYPPSGGSGSDEVLDALEEKLANIRGGEVGYLMMPGPKAEHLSQEAAQGWTFELVGFGGAQGGRDAKPALEYHSDKIAAAVVAEFMRLGQGGAPGGSRAVGDVQQDPFYAGVEALAGVVEEQLNELVARLVAFNFDDADGPPELSMEKADSTSLVELQQFVAGLIEKGALVPDEPLEDFLRDRADLPPADPQARAMARRQKELAAEQQQTMVDAEKAGAEQQKLGVDREATGVERTKQEMKHGEKRLGWEEQDRKAGKKPQTATALPATAIANADSDSGVMVALYPDAGTARALAVRGGEPAERLHVTLAYLGTLDDQPNELRETVEKTVRGWAAQVSPLDGVLSGVGVFTEGDEPVTYWSVDIPALAAARQQLVETLDRAGCPPNREHGFSPHITVAYDRRRLEPPQGMALRFDEVSFVSGSEIKRIPLAAQPGAALVNAARQERPLRSWERLMALDTIEAELDEARGRFELAGLDEALAAARRIAKKAAGRGRLSAPTKPPAGLIDAIREILEDLYTLGRQTVRDELDAQRSGTDAAFAAAAPTAEREMDDRAGLAAHMVVTRVHEGVAKRALAGVTELAQLQLEAEREAKAALKAEADAHAAAALNAGRADQAVQDQRFIRGSRYTSVLDRSTCPECSKADDDVLRPLDDPVRLARKPPNPQCHGGSRCRCLEWFEYDGEIE